MRFLLAPTVENPMRYLVLCFVLAGLTLATASRSSSRIHQGPSWQYSASVSVQLGIRDKWGTEDSVRVVFAVTDPKGETHRAATTARGQLWGEVYFPEDFNTFARAGNYTWRATVGGREVARGRFQYESASDARVVRE